MMNELDPTGNKPPKDGQTPTVPPPIPPEKVVTEADINWACVAHLAPLIVTVLSYVLGRSMLGMSAGLLVTMAIPLCVYFFVAESLFLRFQAMQAALYQLVVMVALNVLVLIAIPLILILVGYIVMLVAALLGLGALCLSIYAAVMVKQGKCFRYPFVADVVEKYLGISPR